MLSKQEARDMAYEQYEQSIARALHAVNRPKKGVRRRMAKKTRTPKPITADGVGRKIAGLLSGLSKSERKNAVKSANAMLKFAEKLSK